MSDKKETKQEKLIKEVEEKYKLKLVFGKLNYYTELNLLPRPVKEKVSDDKGSKKTENSYNDGELVFMLNLLKKYKKFGFKSIVGMKHILAGGNFNLAEELDFLKDLLVKENIEKGSKLISYRCKVSYVGNPIASIAKHEVEMPSGKTISDFPVFPNLGVWDLIENKDRYGSDITLNSKIAYLWVRITKKGCNIDINEPTNFGIYYKKA